MDKAMEAWAAIWNSGKAGAYVPRFDEALPKTTGQRLKKVPIGYTNPVLTNGPSL